MSTKNNQLATLTTADLAATTGGLAGPVRGLGGVGSAGIGGLGGVGGFGGLGHAMWGLNNVAAQTAAAQANQTNTLMMAAMLARH